MRTAFRMLAVGALVGCSSGVAPADRLAAQSAAQFAAEAAAQGSTGSADAATSPDPAVVILPAVWEVAPGQRRGRQVEVRWTTSKCALFRSADVVESAEAVTITVQEQLVGDGLCPTYRVASHTVTLAAPRGNRRLLDGSVSPGRVVA